MEPDKAISAVLSFSWSSIADCLIFCALDNPTLTLLLSRSKRDVAAVAFSNALA